MKYRLLANTRIAGDEVIEEDIEGRAMAEYLLGEYSLAYQGMGVRLRIEVQATTVIREDDPAERRYQ